MTILWHKAHQGWRRGRGQQKGKLTVGPQGLSLLLLFLLPPLLPAGDPGEPGEPGLRGGPYCRLVNATVAAEHEACPVCITFTTTICAGFCMSKMPVLPNPRYRPVQEVCTYGRLRYGSLRLPGCPPGVDPVVSFPVALSCHCDQCQLGSSDCTSRVQHHRLDFCSAPRLRL
ncbi:lutropin subunit beta-like [Ornithorhynchus anatinus]|uniref:lutropin subunit beta-like n=1 Tax=Ornithorhynchus anatinus TaxID=9258 RepID=UPI0010A88C7E|nr:lutropin subunit beta-like [Ornithorhynchus anatinus]